MSIARLRERLKTSEWSRAALQLAAPIPGTPLSLRMEPKHERLPGMRRWVNRSTIEEAMDAHDAGIPIDQYVSEEAYGTPWIPAAVGAGLGGAAGYHLAGKYPKHGITKALSNGVASAPLTAALLGSLTGGAAGLGYHKLTEGIRRDNAREAYVGAQIDAQRNPRPRTALPQRRQDEGSAAALTPMLLHTAPALT